MKIVKMVNNSTEGFKFVASEKVLHATANPDNMNSISRTLIMLETD